MNKLINLTRFVDSLIQNPFNHSNIVALAHCSIVALYSLIHSLQIHSLHMEDWELDFEWLRVRHLVKDIFGKDKLPDMQAVLFAIGIQELGRMEDEFTKEQKQDLMHIAVCRLLSYEGYYEFEGRDQDGWPHWKALRPIPEKGVDNQEVLLKAYVIKYFKEWESE